MTKECRMTNDETRPSGRLGRWVIRHSFVIRISAFVFLLLGFVTSPNARAWWVTGHAVLAEASTSGLPEEMPAFVRAAGKQLAHLAGDPDRFKNPEARYLKAAEAPDHYIDLEDLQGNELPPDRYKAAAM